MEKNKVEKSPGVALILALLFGAFTYLYVGSITKFIVMEIISIFSVLLMFVLIGFITTPLLYVLICVDAYKEANGNPLFKI